jgi:hypothetical protein
VGAESGAGANQRAPQPRGALRATWVVCPALAAAPLACATCGPRSSPRPASLVPPGFPSPSLAARPSPRRPAAPPLAPPPTRLRGAQQRIGKAALNLGGLDVLSRRLHAALAPGAELAKEDEFTLAELEQRLGDAYNLRWGRGGGGCWRDGGGCGDADSCSCGDGPERGRSSAGKGWVLRSPSLAIGRRQAMATRRARGTPTSDARLPRPRPTRAHARPRPRARPQVAAAERGDGPHLPVALCAGLHRLRPSDGAHARAHKHRVTRARTRPNRAPAPATCAGAVRVQPLQLHERDFELQWPAAPPAAAHAVALHRACRQAQSVLTDKCIALEA